MAKKTQMNPMVLMLIIGAIIIAALLVVKKGGYKNIEKMIPDTTIQNVNDLDSISNELDSTSPDVLDSEVENLTVTPAY